MRCGDALAKVPAYKGVPLCVVARTPRSLLLAPGVHVYVYEWMVVWSSTHGVPDTFICSCTAACPPGLYGGVTGLTSVACSGLCPAGRFGATAGACPLPPA